jgi:stage V sporulation protein D (sporulation-specific penicillin-binding protein)
MGVQKQYTADELSEADATVPKVTGNALDYAQQLLADSGFTCRTVGEGTLVRGQIPAAGAVIPGGSQVVLYLDEAEIPTDQVETPDLTGLSPDEARSALSRVGLYLRATGAADYYSGSYQATSQSIDPGTLVDRGTVLDVRFVDGSVQDYGGTAVR